MMGGRMNKEKTSRAALLVLSFSSVDVSFGIQDKQSNFYCLQSMLHRGKHGCEGVPVSTKSTL